MSANTRIVQVRIVSFFLGPLLIHTEAADRLLVAHEDAAAAGVRRDEVGRGRVTMPTADPARLPVPIVTRRWLRPEVCVRASVGVIAGTRRLLRWGRRAPRLCLRARAAGALSAAPIPALRLWLLLGLLLLSRLWLQLRRAWHASIASLLRPWLLWLRRERPLLRLWLRHRLSDRCDGARADTARRRLIRINHDDVVVSKPTHLPGSRRLWLPARVAQSSAPGLRTLAAAARRRGLRGLPEAQSAPAPTLLVRQLLDSVQVASLASKNKA